MCECQKNRISLYLCNLNADPEIFDAFRTILSKYTEDFTLCNDIPNDATGQAIGSFVPVFFAMDYPSLRRLGFRIPKEYVIETEVYYYDRERRKNRRKFLELKSIIDRLSSIAESTNGVSRSDLCDWCIGALRQRFFLDENVHGVGQLDLDHMTINGESACEMLLARLDSIENDVYGFLDALFQDECVAITRAVLNWRDENKGGIETPDAHKVRVELKKLPHFLGRAVKNLSPRGKITALVIDDDNEAVEKLNKTELDSSSSTEAGRNRNKTEPDSSSSTTLQLKDFIAFEDFRGIAASSREGNVQWSVKDFIKTLQKIRDFSPANSRWNLHYNLILLDLCLGEQNRSDLNGYHLLPILHQFFPQIPIVIHSQFEDMGHIVKALNLGANWFLPRKYAGKLPRHVLQIFSNPNWEREWNTLKQYNQVEAEDKNDSSLRSLSMTEKDQCKYLIVCITRGLPGNKVRVKSLHGGIGGAQTFHVRKGDEMEQTPLIVKMDTSYSMFMERERYLRFIRPYIDNCAGRIYTPAVVLDQFHAAIAYTFAGGVDGQTVTLYEKIHRTIKKGCDYSEIEPIVEKLFESILPRLHKVSVPHGTGTSDASSSFQNADWPNAALDEYSDPLSVYSTRMPPMRTIVLDSPPPDTDTVEMVVYKSIPLGDSGHVSIFGIEFPDDAGYPTTVELRGKWIDFITKYRQILPQMVLKIPKDANSESPSDVWGKFCALDTPFRSIITDIAPKTDNAKIGDFIESVCKDLFAKTKTLMEQSPKGIMHGDLNCGNIMIDIYGKEEAFNGNIWLIDFARTRRGPIIFDYTAFFTSVLAILVDKEYVRNEAKNDYYLNQISKKEIWGSLINHSIFGSTEFPTEPLPDDQDELRKILLVEKILVQLYDMVNSVNSQDAGLSAVYPYAIALNLLCLTRILYVESVPEKAIAAQAMLAGALIICERLGVIPENTEASVIS